ASPLGRGTDVFLLLHSSFSAALMQGINISPHKMLLYPILSLVTINVVTLFIRGGNMLLYKDNRVSGILMAKNILAIVLKTCSFVQYRRQLQSAPSGFGVELQKNSVPSCRPVRTPPQVALQEQTPLPEVTATHISDETVWTQATYC
ncbi:hypothetical protein M9458_027689, partial [Cirrhinus mrigala]